MSVGMAIYATEYVDVLRFPTTLYPRYLFLFYLSIVDLTLWATLRNLFVCISACYKIRHFIF